MYPPLPVNGDFFAAAGLFEGPCCWSLNRKIAFHGRNDIQIARQILDSIAPVRILSFADHAFRLDIGGTWVRLGDDALFDHIVSMDVAQSLSVKTIRAAVDAIKSLCRSNVGPGGWIVSKPDDPLPSDIMTFDNGYLDLRDWSFHQYDGRLFAVDVPDFEYDPLAKCPTWDLFIDEALKSEDADTLHAMYGYCMTDDISLQLMLVLLGNTGCGKSTAVRVLEGLISKANFISRTLKDFARKDGLDGAQSARVIAISDAPDDIDDRNHAEAISKIKSISGGDEIAIRPLYKQTTSVTLKARLVMVCNEHPSFVDRSGALLRREVIIPFRNDPPWDPDPLLINKLLHELSGIANRCILALKRFRERGRFLQSQIAKEELNSIKMRQNPVFAFTSSFLVITGDSSDFIPDYNLERLLDKFRRDYGRRGSFKSVRELKGLIVQLNPKKVRLSQRRIRLGDNDIRPCHGLAGARIQHRKLYY